MQNGFLVEYGHYKNKYCLVDAGLCADLIPYPVESLPVASQAYGRLAFSPNWMKVTRSIA